MLPMFHHVAHAKRHQRLYSTWEEGLRLFGLMLRAGPNPIALCLMPDHLHMAHRADRRAEVGRAIRGYARWRNRCRGVESHLWRRQPAVQFVPPGVKQYRVARYIHLNPCRAGLISDPLAWPLSTYRDALGLSLRPARSVVQDPERLHTYVARDPHVTSDSDLPRGGLLLLEEEQALESIVAAVSELMRLPVEAVAQRGAARTLAFWAARAHTRIPEKQIARHFGVTRQAVYRVANEPGVQSELVAQVARDPRFPGLRWRDSRLGGLRSTQWGASLTTRTHSLG